MSAAPAALSLSQIGQIAINARDVKRATAFYRDILGMKFLFEASNLAFFDCGGVRLMLGLPEKPEFDHPASVLYYRVSDIKAAYQALSSRGVKFEAEPHLIARLEEHDLFMAFFRDSEENLLALMCELPRSAATTWWRPGTPQE
jgi:catechol 2,3-dioxygenase-like lactoylglutathione lyase family enzyme